MTRKEIELINALRRDSRTSLTQLGKATDIPMTTVFKIVQRLSKKGLIRKYTCLLDFAELGFPLKAAFLIKTNQKEILKEYLMNHDSLNTLLRLSGDYDFYAEHLFSDMASHTDFADGLMELDVVKVSTHFLTDVKQEEFSLLTKDA